MTSTNSEVPPYSTPSLPALCATPSPCLNSPLWFAIAIIFSVILIVLGTLEMGGSLHCFGVIGAHALTYGGVFLCCTSLVKRLLPRILSRSDSVKSPFRESDWSFFSSASPTYPPLLNLMQQRQQRGYLPDLILTPRNDPTPTTFPFLDHVETQLPPQPAQLNEKRKRELIATYTQQILRGTFPSLNATGEGIVHPAQYSFVLAFMARRFGPYPPPSPTDKEGVTLAEKRSQLEGLISIWNTLIQIRTFPRLNDHVVQQLHQCAENLPPLESYQTEYPILKNHILRLVGEIAKMIGDTANPPLLAETFHILCNKLSIQLSILLSGPQAIQRHRDTYIQTLQTEIGSLCQTSLQRNDLHAICHYMQQEIEQFNQAMIGLTHHHTDLTGTFRPIDLNGDVPLFSVLVLLVTVSNLQHHLQTGECSLDEKIELLLFLSEKIGSRNQPPYSLYAGIVARLDQDFIFLSAPDSLLSEYQFETVEREDGSNREKVQGDCQRLQKLKQALSVLNQKGWGVPSEIGIIPDQRNDLLISQSDEAQNIAQIASQLNNCCIIQGPQVAADYITIHLLPTIPMLARKTYLLKILQTMNQRWALPLMPYLNNALQQLELYERSQAIDAALQNIGL